MTRKKRLRLRTSCDAVKINVLCNMRESALVNIVLQDAQKKNYLTILQQCENLIHLIDRPKPHCFRLHKDCAFYAPESSMKPVARLGTCCGKFSKSGKSKLHVTSLDYLAQMPSTRASITFKWIARCIT